MTPKQMRQILDSKFMFSMFNADTGECIDITPGTLLTVNVELYNVVDFTPTENWVSLNEEIKAEIAHFMEKEDDSASLTYVLAELAAFGCHSVNFMDGSVILR